MAPFDRIFLTRVALIGVLIFMTDSTIACNNDFATCRYDCPAEVVQEHCTSENEVHCAVDGKCCPGFFRTKNSCQVCPDVHFMPDVNNCCECLPCAECDGIKNKTEVVPCNFTSDTVCKIQDDPTPQRTSHCPWIGSTSTTTTHVPTTEASSVDTPSDPQKSKSNWTSLEIGFFSIVGPFVLYAVVSLAICICLCYMYVHVCPSAVPSPRANTAATNSTVPPQGVPLLTTPTTTTIIPSSREEHQKD